MTPSSSRWRWETRRQLLRRPPWKRPLPLLGAALGCGGVGAILLVAGVLSFHPLFAIRGVEFIREQPGTLSIEELEATLALPPKASFTNLDWKAANERLLSIPRVAEVRMSYGWFHELEITVEERRAMVLLFDADGTAWEMSKSGVCLSPRGQALADLPLLSGPPLDTTLRAGLRPESPGLLSVLEVLDALRRDHPQLFEGLSEAHLQGDGTYELFWNESPIVVWGLGSLSQQSLRAWEHIMGWLEQDGLDDVVVDLRFQDQIVIRHPLGTPITSEEIG